MPLGVAKNGLRLKCWTRTSYYESGLFTIAEQVGSAARMAEMRTQRRLSMNSKSLVRNVSTDPTVTHRIHEASYGLETERPNGLAATNSFVSGSRGLDDAAGELRFRSTGPREQDMAKREVAERARPHSKGVIS
jgi:hypothetical protein